MTDDKITVTNTVTFQSQYGLILTPDFLVQALHQHLKSNFNPNMV